jgi:hypothetical protein
MSRTFRTPHGTELPLLLLKGKEYLAVQHRLVWFRETHPLGRIDTECIIRADKFVIYRATISVPTPSGDYIKLADGVKREDYAHFPDAEEKAATGAMGRALACCGFGTQFTGDELDEGERIVDSPTPPQNKPAEAKDEKPKPKAKPALESVPKHIPQTPPWPDEEERALLPDASPGDFKIEMGRKFQGLTVKQAVDRDGMPALQSYINWLEDASAKEGKPLSTPARFLKVNAHRYFELLKKKGGA